MIRITGTTNIGLTEVSFAISGDASTAAFSFDLSRAPFNLDFKGNPPVGIASASLLNGPAGVTMSATIRRTGIVDLQFSANLPNGPAGIVDIILAYGGI